jgi:hypothetical protein
MSLSAHEQQALSSIEERLSGSDPELASLLATFTRLTASEDMPVREKVRARWRQHVTWPGARVILLLLLALALIAGAVVLTGTGGGPPCPLPGNPCSAQLPAHGLQHSEPDGT